jgi:hypothetical protein
MIKSWSVGLARARLSLWFFKPSGYIRGVEFSSVNIARFFPGLSLHIAIRCPRLYDLYRRLQAFRTLKPIELRCSLRSANDVAN